jgi:hypothetical protein
MSVSKYFIYTVVVVSVLCAGILAGVYYLEEKQTKPQEQPRVAQSDKATPKVKEAEVTTVEAKTPVLETSEEVVYSKNWTPEAIENMFGENNWSLWGEYNRTKISETKPQEWRTQNDIIDGWDWSLPPDTPPSPRGLFCTIRNPVARRPFENMSKSDLPITFTATLWVRWKELEPEEGKYNFDDIKDRIIQAKNADYAVTLRILSSQVDAAPKWIEKYNLTIPPDQGKFVSYDVSHPEFHKRYLKLVEALGKSGIPQMDNLMGAYVGYVSRSHGDEGIGPHGKDPDTVPHVIERLDAWAKAFKGMEYKVYMGGESNHGFKSGFGIRRGFVEKYLYCIPQENIGQTVTKDGYLWVDESTDLIEKNAFNGEENEEYSEGWVGRFGVIESFPYRYFASSLRLLQMRCNYVLHERVSTLPHQSIWVGQSLGRTIEDTPDIWCALRESYLKTGIYRKIFGKWPQSKEFPVKNFERWLYQRDTPGAETTATVKIDQPPKMWMVDENKTYDYIARSGKKIGFAVDDRWLEGKARDIAIKVTYFDCGTSTFEVNYKTKSGSRTSEIPLTNTGKLKTATVFVKDFVAEAKGMDYDVTVEGDKDDAVLSFMRLVKL